MIIVMKPGVPMKEIRLEKKDGWVMLTAPELGPELGMAMEFVSDNEAVLLGTGETVFFNDAGLRLTGLKARRK